MTYLLFPTVWLAAKNDVFMILWKFFTDYVKKKKVLTKGKMWLQDRTTDFGENRIKDLMKIGLPFSITCSCVYKKELCYGDIWVEIK